MEPTMILLHYHLYYYIKPHLASREVEFAAAAAGNEATAAAATIICRMAVRDDNSHAQKNGMSLYRSPVNYHASYVKGPG